MPDRLDLKDPVKHQPLTVTTARSGDLEVIGHQRKARPAHLKALTASIERMGFITPLVAVERDGKYVIIDGQHRFSAGVEMGIKEFPIVVVPEKLARRMMSLNIEQSLNIRERSTIALAIYCEMLEESPTRVEDTLKAKGTFHSMARYQIISSANPTKRARKPSDFDKTFDKFIANLEELEASPEKVLREKVE